MFKGGVNTGDKLYKKIYRYAAVSRCPLCIVGSEKQFRTVKRLARGATVQRAAASGVIKIIKALCKFFAETPNGYFAIYKARFQTVAIVTEDVSSTALVMNKTEASSYEPRIITLTGACGNKGLELLKENALSEIISDKGISENLINLTSDKKETPVVLINNRDKIPRGMNARSMVLREEHGEIVQLLSDYRRKQSKRLYRTHIKALHK